MSIFRKWFGNVIPPPPPLPTYPTELGVNVHFLAARATDLQRIASWCVGFVRMDFVQTWFDADSASYDGLVDDCIAAGLTPLLITPYNFPTLNVDPATYAQGVAKAAARYADKPVVWEVMNEPNVSNGSSLTYTAPAYYPYLASTVLAIRAVAPKHVVLTGGTSGLDLPWHQALAPLLKASQVDGVSFHPYGISASGVVAAVRSMHDVYDGRFPVNVTEYGASTAAELEAMLRAAESIVQRFNVYDYQSSIGTPASPYDLVAMPAPGVAIEPPTPRLAGLLAVSGGRDTTTI